MCPTAKRHNQGSDKCLDYDHFNGNVHMRPVADHKYLHATCNYLGAACYMTAEVCLPRAQQSEVDPGPQMLAVLAASAGKDHL